MRGDIPLYHCLPLIYVFTCHNVGVLLQSYQWLLFRHYQPGETEHRPIPCHSNNELAFF